MTTSLLSPRAFGSATETVTTFLPGDRYGSEPALFCTIASSFRVFSACLKVSWTRAATWPLTAAEKSFRSTGLNVLPPSDGDLDRIGPGRLAAGLGHDVGTGQFDDDHAGLAALGRHERLAGVP